MRALEFITEAKVSIRDQIIAAVKKNGGKPEEYFVRFTDVDKLGFSARQSFGRTPDADDPEFDPEYIGKGKGKPALWFYPLKTYLNEKELYAAEKPYVWLIKLNNNAWLQPVTSKSKGIKNPPAGKERVGMLRQVRPWPAAIFFKPAYTVVGKYFDYKSQHKRHGQVKGPAKPTMLQKIKGFFK